MSSRAGRGEALESLAAEVGVPIRRIGLTGGDRLRFEDMFDTSLADTLLAHEAAIPRLMGSNHP